VLFCFDTLPTTLTCPPGNSAITSFSFQIVRGSTTFTATDLNGVQQGDIVKAFFNLAPGCENVRISIPSYETKYPYYDINTVDQQVYKPYSGDTGLFSYSQTSAQRMVQTLVPGCNFQVNFVYGSIIEHMTVNDLYGDRKLAWKNGGTDTCQWAVTPTATFTPNMTQTGAANSAATQSTGSTQTAVANKTATSDAKTATVVGMTQTAVANITGTVVAKTATTSADQTSTASVQQTSTAAVQQTSTSVAQTVTAAVQTASAVAGTMTSVANTTSTARANLTATSVAQTATVAYQQTSTAIALTATSVAGQPITATAISLTATNVAVQTATSAAQTSTA